MLILAHTHVRARKHTGVNTHIKKTPSQLSHTHTYDSKHKSAHTNAVATSTGAHEGSLCLFESLEAAGTVVWKWFYSWRVREFMCGMCGICVSVCVCLWVCVCAYLCAHRVYKSACARQMYAYLCVSVYAYLRVSVYMCMVWFARQAHLSRGCELCSVSCVRCTDMNVHLCACLELARVRGTPIWRVVLGAWCMSMCGMNT